MALTEAELDGLIAAIRDAARTEILPRFRRLAPGDIDSKSHDTDLVTVADRAAERAISDAVARLMPDAAIVGEEAVFDDPSVQGLLGDPGRAVLIDPIDGTRNYANGLAVFGVILAVLQDGETQAGILYDPVMDDWVLARKGGGVWFCRPGEAPARLPGPPVKPQSKAQAFLPLHLYPPAERPRVAATFPEWGGAGSLRCSCHEYRMMAFGHADLILAPGPKPWDHAAGTLMVEEFGGSARVDGTRYAPAAIPGQMPGHLIVIGNGGADFDITALG